MSDPTKPSIQAPKNLESLIEPESPEVSSREELMCTVAKELMHHGVNFNRLVEQLRLARDEVADEQDRDLGYSINKPYIFSKAGSVQPFVSHIDWINTESHEDVPEGNWLCLVKKLNGREIFCTISAGGHMPTVNGAFAHDQSPVTSYYPVKLEDILKRPLLVGKIRFSP